MNMNKLIKELTMWTAVVLCSTLSAIAIVSLVHFIIWGITV